MKVTGVMLDCFLPREEADTLVDGVLTVGWEPDYLNNTVVNGQSEGPISLREGDTIEVQIPSGVWEGTIRSIAPSRAYPDDDWHVHVADVTWWGKYAGLVNGRSGFFHWELIGVRGEVETSAYPSPIPFDVYNVAHLAADCGDFYGRPEARQKALQEIITIIMSWPRAE